DWLGGALADRTAATARKNLALQAMARVARPKNIEAWRAPLREALADGKLRSQAIRTISTLGLGQFDDDLAAISADATQPADLRIDALRVVVQRRPALSDPSIELILGLYAQKAAAPLRLAAAQILARAELSDAQFLKLLGVIGKDALMTPETILPLLMRGAKPATAAALLDYLRLAVQKGWTPSEEKLLQIVK